MADSTETNTFHDGRVAAIADSWGVVPRGRPSGSMSASDVWAVVTADGTEAVLKATVAPPGGHVDVNELRWYRQITGDLPVLTPSLLNSRSSGDVAVVLLSAHELAPPVTRWTLQWWLRLATDLARLHGTVADGLDLLRVGTWVASGLRSPDDQVEGFWRSLDHGWVLDLCLSTASELVAAFEATGPALVHGDCHAENLLVDGERLVWADWQSAGWGSPLLDVAFPAVRAATTPAEVPMSAVVERYAAERDLDAAVVARGVLAAELAMLVIGYPAFAALLPSEQRQRVVDRAALLADMWRSS